MSGENLQALQTQIETVQQEILNLINQRVALKKQYDDVLASALGCTEPLTDKSMIDSLVAANRGPITEEQVRVLFKQIFQAGDAPKATEKKSLLISRKHQAEDTVVRVGDFQVGNGTPFVIAGPCSVENVEQMDAVGAHLSKEGIKILRGGAYKPRTSPYDFQGLGVEGLKILRDAAKKHGMYSVSEIVAPEDVEMACEYIDIIQIGARNMQNFELLKAAGSVRKPILLKRGLSATIEEFLNAAEYIASRGNSQIILCERGIRTYEKATRNTLDISAVPILKQESHLPVVVDVSHSTGRKDIMFPIAKAALAVGADGLIIETHNNPAVALSDANQQLDLPQFSNIMNNLRESGYLSVPVGV
ncbi:bifunctional 3-deoxy-7-phosphoheptulonate synthase/chorismate mutase [Tumebacillus sp. DT12]|uniref:Bifunctional 3-deoxy-7-phosphoheptulonate synthase/chorismate mutase n=1 Tax=Tumebacillus lacus TaxID=2995335 RepID=A0ABT3WXI5_9BACL|nr:bifunctional 3-deoxy-7-phosphoheptulonate synthase/chorismate mutase [Tumebacillus lacus]MCX7569390.1 bifunctional 3-deoxy-7-phosphoheptulonate synthase/chorismate mutase [Tumebacillus lacus]